MKAKYTDPQREAMAAAYEEQDVTAGEVVELAAAGALIHPNGATLAPFDATESAVRAVTGRARLRRERDAALGRVSDMEPRDAVEHLRQRLCDGIDAELSRLELEQRQGGAFNVKDLIGVARAIRELAWLPGPNDPRPREPGAKLDGVRHGGRTRSGLGAAIIAAARTAH